MALGMSGTALPSTGVGNIGTASFGAPNASSMPPPPFGGAPPMQAVPVQQQARPSGFGNIFGGAPPMQAQQPTARPQPQLHPQAQQALSQMHPQVMQALKSLPPGALQTLAQSGLVHPALFSHIMGAQQ